MAESRVSKALCGVMEQALIEKGISPEIAKVLAERACEPGVDLAVGTVKKGAGAVKRKVSKYQREFGKQYRKLDEMKRTNNGSYRSGWNRAKIMSKAHKETRKSLGMR